MADKVKDPDGVYVDQGVQDPSKVYVWVSKHYRDAQAVLKDLGGEWKGSGWEVDKVAFDTNEEKVRIAARADKALSPEDSKAREAARPGKKAKVELTEEEKAAKASERAEKMVESDKTRLPVVEGSVAEGGSISVDGNDIVVTKLGKAWSLDDAAAVDTIKARFDGLEVKVGDSIQFANFEAPEPAAEPGM